MRKAFVRLDFLQVVVVICLTALVAYLLLKSVQNKCNDCGGYFTKCTQREAFDRKYTSFDSIARDSLRPYIWSLANRRAQFDSEEQQSESTSGRKYDWIGLDQSLVLVQFWLVSFTGALATLLRNREVIIICIVLNLIHLIVLVLIEVSDDRDFPSNLFRHGHTVALYSILYVSDTTVVLVLKVLLLVLFLIEFVIELIYFALLRFEFILQHRLPVDYYRQQKTLPAVELELEQRSAETRVQTSLDGSQEKRRSPSKSTETQTRVSKEATNNADSDSV